MSKNISYSDLVSALEYDKDTGLFYWKNNRTSHARKGKVAGGETSGGYISFRLNRFHFYCHRAAWLYHYGYLPDGPIDHINGDKKDNRIVNLRQISNSGNQQNLISARKQNIAGLLGTSFVAKTGKWTAKIRIEGKRLHIGTFDSAMDAHKAYLQYKKTMHPYWSGISNKEKI